MQTGDLLCGIYQIIKPIAQGGLGTIYLAYHENLQKYVVVKRIRDHVASLMDCRIEVDILKSLHHQYLPQVYDFVQTEDGIYTVMDYIPGNDLKYYLDVGCPISEERLLLWLRQLLEVLHYLHTRKPPIIHCDIKPANIMITDNGDICLIDFNISLDGENNKSLVGVSSNYASPEQIRKAELTLKGLENESVTVDARSDLYSLGAVFYRIMSGFLPEDRRIYGIYLKHRDLPYSSALVNIIDKAMMTDPVLRFKSAARMLDALDNQEKWTQTYRRRRLICLAAGCVLIFALIVGAGLMIHRNDKMKNAAFINAYDDYIKQAQVLYEPLKDTGDYTELIQAGETLLKRTATPGLWKTHARERANVLFCIGQAYMGLEQYVQAQSYMEEAICYDQGNVDIYRDLAVACAMQDQTDLALAYLDEACAMGLSELDGALVRGQIAYGAGDYEAAYALAVAAADGHEDNMVARAAVLAVQCSKKLENYEECLQFARQMAERSREPAASLWMQKCGELTVLAIEHGSTAETLIAQGIESYEKLRADGYARLEDLYNLAWLYEKAQQLEECSKLLLTMKESYPQEYAIPMQLAYVYYRMENLKPVEARDYSRVANDYAQSMDLCTAAGVDVSTDAGMVQLGQIIDELRQKGWLEDK